MLKVMRMFKKTYLTKNLWKTWHNPEDNNEVVKAIKSLQACYSKEAEKCQAIWAREARKWEFDFLIYLLAIVLVINDKMTA